MKISTTVRYGVRALYELASQNSDEPMQIRDIARSQDLTPRYLEQIFHKLKKAGLIEALRGPRGGYYLLRDPAEITIGDVVRSLEGPIQLVHCTTSEESGEICPRESSCPTRLLWKELGDKFSENLDAVTLKDLCEKPKNEKSFFS